MNRKYLLELADYNQWANSKVIDWLQQVSDTQWHQELTSSFSTIRQTVLHMVSAEKVWLDFWGGNPEPVYLSATFNGTKEELLATWAAASASLKQFVAHYPEEKYFAVVSFKWPRGGYAQMEFTQTFAHFINHATYHRGQLVTMLRQLGFNTFSSTDMATYHWQRNQAG